MVAKSIAKMYTNIHKPTTAHASSEPPSGIFAITHQI